MTDKIMNFFGFKTLPFSKQIPSQELFKSKSLHEVFSLIDLALNNEDFALITGTAGSGKSSALRYFVSQLDPAVYPHVYITAENYKIGTIAKLMLKGLNLPFPIRALQRFIW